MRIEKYLKELKITFKQLFNLLKTIHDSVSFNYRRKGKNNNCGKISLVIKK